MDRILLVGDEVHAIDEGKIGVHHVSLRVASVWAKRGPVGRVTSLYSNTLVRVHLQAIDDDNTRVEVVGLTWPSVGRYTSLVDTRGSSSHPRY